MYIKYLKFSLLGVTLMLILATFYQVNAAEPEATPPPRDIPGITADDVFPSGCVSCHLNFIDRNIAVVTLNIGHCSLTHVYGPKFIIAPTT